MRRHPGWAGIARYDQALARLADAASRRPAGITGDPSLTALPAAEAGTLSVPVPALAAERARLATVEETQVARLRERQAQSRARQISLSAIAWQRQADTGYRTSLLAAQDAYARRAAALAASGETRRLNLTLQIKALQKIVGGWKDSDPPTPRLSQARLDLARKQDQLSALQGEDAQSLVSSRATRDAQIAQAQQDRDAYVASQTAQEDARLQVSDARQAAAYRARLSAQRAVLLREEQSPAVQAVAPAGELSAQSLPPGAPSVTVTAGAAQSLRAAHARLLAQRSRWIAYLYSDTQAAALDEAGRRHWIVTFGPPLSGQADVTGALEVALRSRVWKA